jgi:cation transport ATPase
MNAVLHETRHRLRLAAPRGQDLEAVRHGLEALPGVRSVRANDVLSCLVVTHDGQVETRAAVLARLQEEEPARRLPRPRGVPRSSPVDMVPVALAAAAPLLPAPLRQATTLAAIAARVVGHPKRLRRNAQAVLFDATSLTALALNGQEIAASSSLLLRFLAERWSARLVRQADELLARWLPTEAARYHVLRAPQEQGDGAWWPLRELRAGDRLRLYAGDVVPVDGCIVDGEAVLASPSGAADDHAAAPGEHVAAGERLRQGTVELLAEADAAGSRLERLRTHLRQVMGARDPSGLLRPGIERFASVPLTAAALVLGFTGDTARAATMLQADPKQGLDLALPLAREAVLATLARHGLLATGLEAVERLALASTLVLQDMGVVASGRWRIEAINGVDTSAAQVRRWLAALADVPLDTLDRASLSDAIVLEWVRHGAVLRADGKDLHLASGTRLKAVWGLEADSEAPPGADEPPALRRRLALVSDARVLAWITLASPWRDGARERLAELHALGFKRIAIVVEDDGSGEQATAMAEEASPGWLVRLGSSQRERREWLAQAARNGRPLVMVHTRLRDLLPPGSVSLTPLDADAGSHGVLLGDPLQGLATARRLARRVHGRLQLQQQAAAATDASLITASALRWLPPIATSLAHHGFSLLLLLDSMRLGSLEPPATGARRRGQRAAATAEPHADPASTASPAAERDKAAGREPMPPRQEQSP